jgi:peroxiredoxin/regulation of enolase protein 1 (concanavalin A-like superfamily)
MIPSSFRRHLRSAVSACLCAVALCALWNSGELRAAESPDDLPRYRLKPGQELKYHGQAEFKYGKNANGLPRGSATDWRVWVARANANGSWRVIVSVSSLELPAAGKDSAQSEQPVDHQMALFDLFPDGHTLPVQASENIRVEPGKLFPRLSPDALAIKKGWADDREDGFVHCDYTADPQHTSGTEWAFDEDLQRAWDKIYDATTRTKFSFDRDRGLIQRAESELTWGNGFDEKGKDTIEFIAVQDHDESWTKSFAEEADRYFAAADAYHKQLIAAGHDADQAPEMLTKAETELKSARANLTLTDFTEQLDKQLSEHKRQADYIAKEAKELAERKDKPAAEWSLDDLNGKSHALADYRGKVVVLDFWYRGCGWCIRAMPQVQQVANDFKNSPVAVLGMNTDRDEKDAQFVVEAMQLSYPILKATDVPAKYGVHGFPTLVIIDQQGTVRDIHVGYSKTLRAEVSKIIKELLASVRSSGPVLDSAVATSATETSAAPKPKAERSPPTVVVGQATAEPGHAVRPVAVLRDDFNGKFALNWKIVREDKDHFSLTRDPGHLTIITQRGTIHGDVEHDAQSEGICAKNIFFIRNPVSETSDFSITLAVSKFEPTTYYQQVGLLCYDDDANYVKWSFEYSWQKPDTTNFVMVRQTDMVPEHDLVTELKNPGRFWLRVTRHGTDYECAYSTDGDKFTVAGSRPWGQRPPKYVGFLAKNGGNPQAGEIDVSIDSFEVRSPPTAAAPAKSAALPAAESKALPGATLKAMPAGSTRPASVTPDNSGKSKAMPGATFKAAELGTFVLGSNKSDKTKTTYPASVLGEERPDGSLFYTGEVVDKTTTAPIRGAVVTVRRRLSAAHTRDILEETKHTTDEQGKYSFVIPAKQVAERLLYIELDVEHPDYATKAGFGYALGMIRKNAKLNDPPFFHHVELDPAAAVTGRIVGPDGKPIADAPLLAYSNVNPRDFSNDNFGSFVHTKSGADGTFRLNMTKTGPSVFWIVPENYAPRQIVSGTKRGDWGDVQMAPGVGLKGQVVDATGKPVAGVWVNVTDEKSQSEIQMPVGTSLVRSGQADAEGRFEIGPMKPGKYRLQVDDYPREICYHSRERKLVDIPAVFLKRTITIGDAAGEPIVVRAVPHVLFEAQYVDSKGAKKGGWEVTVFGKMDGEYYLGQFRPGADGRIQGILPHGIEDAKLELMSNEHGALRIRLGKDKPLLHGRDIKLGTVEADITGVEIVKYTAPIVLLKVVDEDGKPIPKAKAAAIYESDDKDKLVRPVGSLPTSIFFEKQPGGILRTSQMLPDEKTKFVASAEGYEEAHETLSLPEEESRELTLVLKRSTGEKEKDQPAAKK